ncbi:MAG TPA: CDP-alcohol phosphatidyltransferase family protein [Galbitalea sp.]|jgi:phosphatidylglycerophosphate synthase|nr:CDP-alcohol phosphatidyltransferase family protein [Galbitalea sp.]
MANVQLLPWLWATSGIAALVALTFLIPLSPAGFVVGATCLIISSLLVCLGLGRRRMTRLGAANAATATRSVLVGLITSLVVTSFTQPIPAAVLVELTVVALLLDAVDGWLARRFHCDTELGARFDMEVDAYLMLVLSAFDARTIGWWVLAIGLMRYAFVAVGWVVPWMRRQLPPRYWRKVVTAVSGIASTFGATGWLPLVAVVTLVAALLLLTESFGRDVVWLFRRRAVRPAGQSPVPKRASSAA